MGNNMIKDWKDRWVLMKSDQIEYYRDRLDDEPAGSISLISLHAKTSAIRPHAIELVTPNRSYWFVAESDESRDEWIVAMSNNSQALMDQVLSGERVMPVIGSVGRR